MEFGTGFEFLGGGGGIFGVLEDAAEEFEEDGIVWAGGEYYGVGY